MRLFVAAELPEELVDALAETSAALREQVRGRYVAPDSFHVTLAFLGEVEGGRVGEIARAIDAACALCLPFLAELGELGSFGKGRKAMLWQGFAPACAEDFRGLATRVRSELSLRGFDFDGKKFVAHVTLMRAADLQGGTLPAPVRAAGTIEHVALFRSDLSGDRPVYDPLHLVQLGE